MWYYALKDNGRVIGFFYENETGDLVLQTADDPRTVFYQDGNESHTLDAQLAVVGDCLSGHLTVTDLDLAVVESR